MAEGNYEFRPRLSVLSSPELQALLRVAPPPEALGRGFTLQEADVDQLVQAARELEGGQVVVDPNVPAQQNLDTLLKVIRVLQLALDVQFTENEEATADFNELQNNEVRRLREENNRLRELRDREEATGDVGELRRRNEDLLDQLDELEEETKRLRELERELTARNTELEDSIKEKDKEVLRLQTRQQETQERYDRLRDDNKDLQQRYRMLSQDYDKVRSEAQLQDTKTQSDWKIERLTKDNRALELANTELRKEVQDVKHENLEVSEKIVELNTVHHELLAKSNVLEARIEEMAGDKDNLLSIQDELRTELQDKMALLDEFEDKFNRQYRSWEDEKAGLMAQIEALKRDLKTGRRGKAGEFGDGAYDGGASSAELERLRRDLNEAKEKEVLLLEAYEQLENDVAKEVDRALGRQAEEMQRLQRRVDFLQDKLEQQDDDALDMRDHQADLEGQLRDALERNKKYEQNVYGLPQAVEEIRQLKSALGKEEHRTRDLITELNKQAAKVEDLFDENQMLRKKCGMSDTEAVDIKGIKMQKEATLAQLRALNALLERQVADLEEERRKLRMEMKFRAKYHGQHALEMGLTPDKLLLLEQYADDLKNNRVEEARVVEQLQKRVEFLEVRLAEVMAYADIPPSMRPALSEFDPTGLGTFHSAIRQAMEEPPLPSPAQPAAVAAAMPAIKAKEVEAIKAGVQKALAQLRQMSQSLYEGRNISDKDYQRFVDNVIAQLQDADKALEVLLKDPAALGGTAPPPPSTQEAPPPSLPSSPGPHSPGRPGAGFVVPPGAAIQLVPGDASYLADAVAEELRQRLKQLARQVADLQVNVAQKDMYIKSLLDQKAEMEKKFGVSFAERKSDYVTTQEYEGLQLENQSLKEQLIQCLEELAAREREVSELHDTSLKYHTKMQTFADQVKLLYREYAGALDAWKVEKNTIDKKSRKNQADAEAYKIATRELQTALDTLSKSRDMADVEKEYLDTVRRMAVVQIKQAKLARELEASVSGERALVERVNELEEEARDFSSTARSRIRWLEASADQAKRRVEQLFRELEASAPLKVYHSLVQKHARLQHEHRKLVEEQAQNVMSMEEAFKLRDDLAHFMVRYDQMATQAAEAKARLHSAELAKSKDDKPVDMLLSQELVAARVQEEAAMRQGELTERDRDRVQRSLAEMQEHAKSIEQRLAQSAAELELARRTTAAQEQRLLGAKTREEVDELLRRLDTAETSAAEVQKSQADLVYKVEESERRADTAVRDRQRFLAEITNLKAALRDMSGRSEQAALVGKLHLELDHSRAKESLARNALNRSELQRIELEKEVRRLKQEQGNLTGRMTAHQDQAIWADKQRHEAQAQLEISLASRTENWKARLWGRKLEQLKERNQAMADGLELARSRILKLEDAKADVELKLEFKEDLASMAHRGPSELSREVARLGEQLLQVRLERGKLQREGLMLREKVNYTERVNAELHDLLEKYEAEYFQAQSHLEADRVAAEARAITLQEDMVKLQERINALLASKDLGDPLRASKHLGGGGGLGKALDPRKAQGEREMLINKIEELKLAREEAEHLRTELHRLREDYDATMQELGDVRRHHKDALDRLQQQSEALLYALNHYKTKGADATVLEQMKAVAEATINELKVRVKERDRILAGLRKQLEDEQAAALGRHNEDREEIERLNQKLFERNDQTIQDMKDVLDRLPLKQAGQQTSDELLRLRDALERAEDTITVLKNRLEQKDAALDVVKLNYEQQMKLLQEEAARAKADADARSIARDEGPTKAQLQKLSSQLKMKDEMLRQLKAAIKALEAKLMQVMKEHADEKMQQASWQAQERLQEQVDSLQAERDRLAEELALARDQATAGATSDSGLEAALERLRRQLQEETERSEKLDKQLAKEREELSKFKNARGAVVDLTTGMSIEATRQIEDLQKKLNVMERQCQSLKRKLKETESAGPQGGQGGGDDGGDDGSSRRPGPGRGTISRRGPGTGRRATLSEHDAAGEDQGPADDPEAEERRERALLQWEEGKKLNAKIDNLKKQVAAKTADMVNLQRDMDRKAAQAVSLQQEVDKQSAVIRDLSDKLKRAQEAPRTDKAKLQEYMQKCTALEEERDRLLAQLSRLQQQDSPPSTSAAAPPASPGGAQLRRDEELFELRLQRDQLQGQVKRLKERLAEATAGANVDGTVTAPRRGVGTGTSRPSGGAAGGITAAREAELLSTITNLKVALEKATANTMPTTKYMAEVTKRKEAQKDLEAARAELDRQQQLLNASGRMVVELQAANAELRRQVRAAASSAPAASAAPGVAELGVQLSNMEMLLGQREEEVAALRAALSARDAELEAVGTGPSTSGGGGREVSSLRRQLAELERENEDLRNELNAFDPSFWDEVMSMKQQNADLSRRISDYEDTIRALSDRLGITPPVALGQRSGSAGRQRGGGGRS